MTETVSTFRRILSGLEEGERQRVANWMPQVGRSCLYIGDDPSFQNIGPIRPFRVDRFGAAFSKEQNPRLPWDMTFGFSELGRIPE